MAAAEVRANRAAVLRPRRQPDPHLLEQAGAAARPARHRCVLTPIFS